MHFDLRNLDADFYDNPYPVYKKLQAEGPVVALPDGGYVLTRYDEIRAVYRDAGLFSSDKRIQFAPVFGETSSLFEHHTTSLVFNDPPLHTHVRKAIGNALSNRVVKSMQTDLVTLVDGLLDRLSQTSRFDLIGDYASAIPVEVIGNLLGVPRSEREPLRAWSLAILGSLEVGLSDAARTRGERAVVEFVAYLRDLIARRRADRSDTADDILARLANWESSGRKLSAAELHHQCIFLLNAGHETTTNLIGNGIELLLRFPVALAKLRAEPKLIGSAVEEILRYESPNQLGNRTTTQRTQLAGVDIPADTVLTLCVGAGNRDPLVFEDADRFDITRNPNPHLAFGSGIHTCAGLNVARLEGEIAIQRFFDRFSNVLIAEPPRRAQRARFRGYESLIVSVA